MLKRLTQYIETHLADDSILAEAKPLRRLFLSEAITLRTYLLEAMRGHERVLDSAIKALKRDTDAKLREEASDIHAELIAVRRALYRLLLARQERGELVNEWNDWKRHAEFSGMSLHHAREEREEMLASELRLRGLRMSTRQIVIQETREPLIIDPADVEPISANQGEPKTDLLQDWEDVMTIFESSLPESEWEDVMDACMSPAAHPVSASAVMRRAKHHLGMQAKRKRHKKQTA